MDYTQLGLKCGIEIHQQLSGRKLFCSCAAKINDAVPDGTVRRKLRAVIGETGRIDQAAAHEEMRDKEFVYNIYKDCNCLIELDEEPPRPINSEALNTVILISRMLNATPVDEIQVMRKTVIDGSNTTGFQRTALAARNGFITTSEGKIRIPTICIEEDAAKIVKREDGCDIYNLSRLGIPLIEIGTEPDIKSPVGAQEAAEKLGLVLRSTDKIMRGLGTIRQDVNVSIAGGARIEIKGAQDLRLIAKLVETEAMRQYHLLQIKAELEKNDAHNTLQELSKEKLHDLTHLFKNTASSIVKKAFEKDGVVFGVRLPGFAGLPGRQIAPGKRLGTELADYARVMAGVGGIFHSDELPNYGITENEIAEVRKQLGCKTNDAFVLVADAKQKAERAIDAVLLRAKITFAGVPKEVRKANADATSSFLRPMPGEARMYPETDVMPIKPEASEAELPELIEEKAKRYEEELKLGKDLAKVIARSGKNKMFELFVDEFPALKPAFIAETIVSLPQSLKKLHKSEIEPSQDQLEQLLGSISQGKLPKEAAAEALADIVQGRFDEGKYAGVSDAELENEIKEIISKNPGAGFAALMGEVMKKYRGKVEGKRISEALKGAMKSSQ
jgi:glutamyl-tRNA(Gln) amidotransferase subunit E